MQLNTKGSGRANRHWHDHDTQVREWLRWKHIPLNLDSPAEGGGTNQCLGQLDAGIARISLSYEERGQKSTKNQTQLKLNDYG